MSNRVKQRSFTEYWRKHSDSAEDIQNIGGNIQILGEAFGILEETFRYWEKHSNVGGYIQNFGGNIQNIGGNIIG